MLNYKGLRGTLERLIVPDAQIDRQIDELLERHTKVVPVDGRPSRAGDELVLDYAGYCDGVQFEGGTAAKQTLTLGSGAFIPGFEAQLEGKHAGDDVLVRVTFPSPYHAQELAGREAVFKCHIHAVQQRQRYAPDDEFARSVGNYETLGELREAMRKGLQAYADRQAEEDMKLKLLDQLTGDFEDDIPQEQLRQALDAEMRSLEAQLARQGLTLDAYCQFTGKTREQLRDDMLPDARKGIVRQRVLGQIAQQEGIVADEASVSEALQRICRENDMTPEQLAPHLDEAAQRAIVQNVIFQKALDCLMDNAVIETVERGE